MKTRINFRKANLIKVLVTLHDAVMGALCMYAAIKWRYSFETKAIPENLEYYSAFVFAVSVIIAWMLMGTHKALWRFTSISDIRKFIQSSLLASLLTLVLMFLFFNRAEDFPRSAPFIAAAFFILILLTSRSVVMHTQTGTLRNLLIKPSSSRSGAILIGQSKNLSKFLNDIHRKNIAYQYNILGIIELSATHKGRSIHGIPILGDMDDLDTVYKSFSKPDKSAITLIATDEKMDRGETVNLIRTSSELGAPLVRVNADNSGILTPFETADLIGRSQQTLDSTPVRQMIAGKRVLITGAGGTIGSEIARQALSFQPEMLCLLDISEFNLFEIDRSLTRDFSDETIYKWRPFFADITNRSRIEDIMQEYKPHIVIHAAAKKHVRLGNLNPIETLNTNVSGTQVLLEAASKFGVENFVLISTDKAVEPSNIMGASKRIAELLTLAHKKKKSALRTCAVRFGNVAGSNGSVIPLFEEQIARGGPVTVTDKNVTRFFMTIQEAASLVLQAAALNTSVYKDGNNIFVLEMGAPVKISKLARQLIRLRGLVPDQDIKIVFTGLKPGEKLEESLHNPNETLENTYVKGIIKVDFPDFDPADVEANIARLIKSVQKRDKTRIRTGLKTLLNGYEPNGGLSLPPDL